jgi:hypothetical protein
LLSSFIGGLSIVYILEKLRVSKKTVMYMYVLVCVCIILPTVHMWKSKGYANTHESHFAGIYLSTTDTGESSPIWSVRFMERTPPSYAQVVSGEAKISEGKRTSTIHEYQISAKSPSRIVEHTLYFPGWNVYVDGVKTGIQFQDPDYRGLMTYWVTEGDHAIRVVFEDTLVRNVANYISVVSIGILIFVNILAVLWRKNK